MPVEFCPKCSSVLIPEKGKDGKIVEVCAHCGFSKKSKIKVLVEKEKIAHKKQLKGKISKSQNEFADYKHKCQKCGYGKAQVIDIGSFYSDEDDLIMLKCGKCGWSERSTKKTG